MRTYVKVQMKQQTAMLIIWHRLWLTRCSANWQRDTGLRMYWRITKEQTWNTKSTNHCTAVQPIHAEKQNKKAFYVTCDTYVTTDRWYRYRSYRTGIW